MHISDLSKDLQRFLLAHWMEKEINAHLQDPEYFFEHVVGPRLEYLRRKGDDVPRVRLQKTSSGEFRALLVP